MTMRLAPNCRGRWSLAVAACAAVAAASPAYAQPDVPQGFTLQAVKTAVPPRIDGVVESGEWDGAARGEDFIQFEPNRGDPARLQTVVFVLYDDEHLYVAFEAYDPEPLMGQMTQRDAQLWNDDSV